MGRNQFTLRMLIWDYKYQLVATLLTLVVLGNDGRNLSLVKGAEDVDLDKSEPESSNEPPFPELFYDPSNESPVDPRRVRIVTEVIASGFRKINEEILDLDRGLAAYILQRGSEVQDTQVLLTDAGANLMHRYQPYTCTTSAMNDSDVSGIEFWSTYKGHYGMEGSQVRKLRIFGLAAMWLFAADAAKKYSSRKQFLDTGGKVWWLFNSWTVTDYASDLDILFTLKTTGFMNIEMNREMNREINRYTDLSLKILSHSEQKVLRTINILSIDYELDYEIYENFLETPVGYGCRPNLELDEQQSWDINSAIDDNNKFWTNYLWVSSHVELEVSATKVDPSTSEHTTDTISIELAHLPMRASGKTYDLMMRKIKSGSEELKTVEDHLYNVKYQIDIKEGNCRMGRIAPDGKSQSKLSAHEDAVRDDDHGDTVLKFSNGLRLSLDRKSMQALFTNGNGFKRIKRTTRWTEEGKKIEFVHTERTIPSWPIGASSEPAKIGRLMRTRRIELTGRNEQYTLPSSKFESITIWVLDASTQSQIMEIYHLNVISEQRDPMVRQFDISQECYLNNDKMQPGTDYAWVEFFYPLNSRQLDLVVHNDPQVKEEIYQRLVSYYGLARVRVPRLELMFDDEGLIVRALIIDLPSLEMLYEPYDQRAIIVDRSLGDFQFFAPDLRHCAALCEMYSCKSLSFCKGTRACLLGMRAISSLEAEDKPANGSNQELTSSLFCATLSVPAELESRLFTQALKLRLTSLLSIIAYQDYDYQDVPEIPDELSLPRDETGITSDEEYARHISAYLTRVFGYLMQRGDKKPPMTISLVLDGHFVFLLPAKSAVENGPLDDFRIPGRLEQGDSQGQDKEGDPYDSNRAMSFFHEGLSMARFDLNTFEGELRSRPLLLSGLVYEQCALGCLASKCGTFSYCPSRKECVITMLDTIKAGKESRLIENDEECFIAQRDFVKNYQKYPSIKVPLEYHESRVAESESDCALMCLRQTDGRCLSFEFCARTQQHTSVNCYLQLERRPAGLFEERASGPPDSSKEESEPRANITCDHYERSYLAEFNQIQASRVTDQMLSQLRTTEYKGSLTPMECADICLNQHGDCSAFQFCFEPSGKHALTCLMIQSKPAEVYQQEHFEVLIDDEKGRPIEPSMYLEYNNLCHVFALRPDTLQSHLRDLAMGNTMTVEAKMLSERLHSASGYIRLSWGGYTLLFLSVTLSALVIGLSYSYARERRGLVRDQIDRARHFVGL